MNENTTTTYRIYCKPKQGAQAEGHYRPEWYRTRAGAEAAIKELEEDGISVYWKLSIEAETRAIQARATIGEARNLIALMTR